MVNDNYPHIRVTSYESESFPDCIVKIHYNTGPCWFALNHEEARELAEKILAYLDEGVSLPLNEKHYTDI